MMSDNTKMFFALLFFTYTRKENKTYKGLEEEGDAHLKKEEKMLMVMVPQKHSLLCCSMLTCAQIKQTK
jgi:hypothetical protein